MRSVVLNVSSVNSKPLSGEARPYTKYMPYFRLLLMLAHILWSYRNDENPVIQRYTFKHHTTTGSFGRAEIDLNTLQN